MARSVPETQIINMTDREGDIIEIFETAIEQEKQGGSAYFIIRSKHDRCLEEKDEETKLKKKLRQKLKETASLGEVEFTISPTEKRKGREVKQQINAVSVTLKPKHKKNRKKLRQMR